MNLFTSKKLLLAGFFVVLLIGIPLTLYVIQQQQESRSRAQKSTILAFDPPSTENAPLQKNIGDTIPLDITINPGSNLVSYLRLEIQYDETKLATASANAFVPNTSVFPTVLEGPIYQPGRIAVTLSIGSDPTKAVQALSKVATVSFKAIASTITDPTLITYTSETQVLSLGANDQASEDVLSSAEAAAVAISDGTGTTPTPTLAGGPTPTPTQTLPLLTPTPTRTPGGGGTGGTPNEPPVCNSLVADRAATGPAPFVLTFTVNGTDSDGTISKATFNFGDGGVSNVTDAGGINTNTVNVQIAHIYNNPGVYTASAILTDSNGTASPVGNCTLAVTVEAPTGGSPNTATGQTTPVPLPTTGPSGIVVGAGIALGILTLVGGVLFFAL